MPKLNYFTLKKNWDDYGKLPNVDTKFRETCGRFNMSLFNVSQKLDSPADKQLRQEIEKYQKAAGFLQYDPREQYILNGIATMEKFPEFLQKKFGDKTAYERIMETLGDEGKFFNDDLLTAEHFTEWGIDLKALNKGKEPELPATPSLVRWKIKTQEEIKEELQGEAENKEKPKEEDIEEPEAEDEGDRTFTEEEIAAFSLLATTLETVSKNQQDRLRGTMATEIKGFSNDLNVLSEDGMESLYSGREKLRGLKAYLEKPVGKNGKTNYDAMCEGLSYEDRNALMGNLEIVSGILGLGIDASALEKGRKARLSQYQREEEERQSNQSKEERQSNQAKEERQSEAGEEEFELREKDEEKEEKQEQKREVKLEKQEEKQEKQEEKRRMRAERESSVRPQKAPAADKPISAIKEIEAAQKALKDFDVTAMSETQQQAYANKVAKIMAVRMAGSVPRDKKKVLARTMVSSAETDKAAEALINNKTFKKFMRENLTSAKAGKLHKALTKGHGGALEDMFKDYVKTLPPGELSNDPALKRYMPTALDRIEHLQDCVKKAGNPAMSSMPELINKERAAAAAEIMLIRNMVKAEWGTKTPLKAAIPTADKESGVPKLNDQVNEITNDDDLYTLMTHEDVQSKLTKGHGGQMSEAVRDVGGTREALSGNSISDQMKKLKEQAAEMSGSQTINEAEARKIVSQYCVLVQAAGEDEKNANRDAPWRALDEMNNPEVNGKVLSGLLGTKNAETVFRNKMAQILEEMGDFSAYGFMEGAKNYGKEYTPPMRDKQQVKQTETSGLETGF